MVHLKNSVRRMMSKGKSSKRPENDGASVYSGPVGFRYSQTSADSQGGRPSLDSVGSVYSHTTSDHNSPRPPNDVERVVQRPRSHELWFDGVQQNPYTYLHSDVNETAAMGTELYRRSAADYTPRTDSIRTTHRSVQSPVAAEKERNISFPKSTRRPTAQDATTHSRSQGSVGERDSSMQLTQLPGAVIEDDEEESIQETKREIRRLKVLDVNSTRNALQLAHQAFEVGTNTLQTLQEQGDRLHNAEANLEQVVSANKIATQKLKELKQANRMVPVKNTFTAARTERNAYTEMLAARRHDREQRDHARAAHWHAWKKSQIHTLTNIPRHRGAMREDVLARAKYQFEADSEDERLEDMFDDNVEELVVAVQQLKGVATAMNAQVDHQNKVLDRTGRLADLVDDGLALNQARLDRFR